MIIKKKYFHISGTKTMKEAEAYGFKAIYADTDGFYAKYVPEMKKE